MKKAIRIIALAVITLAVAAGALFGYQIVQHNRVVAEIERESPTAGITTMSDLGTTKTLEIVPLVEKAAAGPQYQAEHGVSYLIKTDTATILLDVGFNQAGSDPSPLEHNMAQLGVDVADIDAIVISHWHPDHTGGQKSWEKHTFSLGNTQVSLDGKQACVPVALTYPGLSPVIASQPIKIAEGVASIGILPFAEVMAAPGLPARNAEQALVVSVAGRGAVLITGCGHPTLSVLVARAQAVVNEPIIGAIGGLHLAGAPDTVVQANIDLLKELNAQVARLSVHDSDASVIESFRSALPAAYHNVMVGQPIQVASLER